MAKLYNDPLIESQLKRARESYSDDKEKILGIGLLQPFEKNNSASRKLMFANQLRQSTQLISPDVPYISTSYENQLGKMNSSLIKADKDYKIIGKVDKYSAFQNHHYYLIVLDEEDMSLDVIERVYCYHNTEMYGFLYDNSELDSYSVGETIRKGSSIKKSISYDSYDNYRYGANINCSYISSSQNTDDSVIISESTSKKLATPSIKVCEIPIGGNDIPINLYGDQEVYKILPDIGEKINNGILAATRKEIKEETFFTQSNNRLRDVMISDTKYLIEEGTVVEIEVYSNDLSDDLPYHSKQIQYYIEDDKRFCREFIDVLRPYIDNSDYIKSYELSKMYSICENKLNGRQYMKDGKQFSGIIINVTVFTENTVKEGDKISNRYGGKGVVSKIVPDNNMPMLSPNMIGDHAISGLIWNFATCVKRLNSGQLIENSLNNFSRCIIHYISTMILNYDEAFNLLYDYLYIINPEFADQFKECIEYSSNDEEAMFLLNEFINEFEDGMLLSLKPVSNAVGFDTLRKLYEKFPFVRPRKLIVPIERSNGKVEMIESEKRGIISSQYILRLKQYADEKHSATSLSSTNIRNENSKSKASKMYTQKHSSTPVKMGEMEQSLLMACGSEITVTMLMLYSTSPQGRRCAEQLCTGDVSVVDVHITPDCKSRSVEKVNATLKTMGTRLEFTKTRINKESAFLKVDKTIPAFTKVETVSPYQWITDTIDPFDKVISIKNPFEKVD